MNELRAFPGARVPAGAGAAPATAGSVMAVAFSELQCAVWNCCSKEIQGEHRWDENINSFLGMDISYIDGILSMSVKAKIDDLFKKYPFLASGSRWCREELVYRNQGLVRSIVKKYFYTGLEINDIIQEGNYGLVKAIDMFDVSKDVKFATYATYWIKAYINNCIQNQARMIRLPYHIHDKLRIMKKAETNNTYTEIDKILNMKKEKLEKIKKASLDTLSFDTYSVSSDNVLIDTLVYDPGSSIENSLYDSIISNLEENEKLVIFYRYYYKNNLNLTSSKLNMNKRKVRKIEKNAIKKLKNSLVKF